MSHTKPLPNKHMFSTLEGRDRRDVSARQPVQKGQKGLNNTHAELTRHAQYSCNLVKDQWSLKYIHHNFDNYYPVNDLEGLGNMMEFILLQSIYVNQSIWNLCKYYAYLTKAKGD